LRKWILGALYLQQHLQSVHLRGSQELARLQKVGPNIAYKRLHGKWWLLLAILLHFLDLVLNHNGFVDHVSKISIIRVEQLELNFIVQPIQKHVLLLFIRIDVIWGVYG
jgi:hypothetical protein